MQQAENDVARAPTDAKGTDPGHIVIYPGSSQFAEVMLNSLRHSGVQDRPEIAAVLALVQATAQKDTLHALSYALSCIGKLADHLAFKQAPRLAADLPSDAMPSGMVISGTAHLVA